MKTNCTHQEYLYLIASHGSPAPTTIGMVAANIELLDDIFVAKTRLHLSVIYTIPSMRRQGIARLLIEKALEWGQSMNAVEADLNVLTANPARQLYEHLGFQPHEISMANKLGDIPHFHARSNFYAIAPPATIGYSYSSALRIGHIDNIALEPHGPFSMQPGKFSQPGIAETVLILPTSAAG